MIKKDRPLRDLQVLVIDCQATHTDPTRGSLFEIGWGRTRASDVFAAGPFEIKTESYLVDLPDNIKISNPIKKMTGIQETDFRAARPLETIWARLQTHLLETAAQNNMSVCPTIIHYARYEGPYLECVHNSFNPTATFPFHIICTHQIVKRLIPGLPRKGLRAVAGYFGRALPETKRSLHHVNATAFIWSQLVNLFEEQNGPSNFSDLVTWMNSTPPPAQQYARVRKYPMEKDVRTDVPTQPGLYRMFRSNGDLLYIGKAKSLKLRVNSYFRQKEKHSEHILDMLSQARSLSFSVTKTALEAALKESDEIKVLSPPYNIALRLSEESPVFTTRDLRSFDQRPDVHYRIGPLPTKKYIEAFPVILNLLNETIPSITPDIMLKALSVQEDSIPESLDFIEGLHVFKKRHNHLLKSPMTIPSLMKLGTVLWKEKRIAQENKRLQAEIEKHTLVLKPDPPKKGKKKMDPHWTPESVAKVFSHIIRIGTYQIRRSRWLTLLTEATISWENRDRSTRWKNLVVFKNGLPVFEDPIPLNRESPSTKGSQKSYLAKQFNFDVFTYDRMRILTTEIRRIVDEERSISILLGPKYILKTEQLREILKWV